jgi:hypothetical protein
LSVFPQAELLVVACRHRLILELPEEIAAQCTRFIASLPLQKVEVRAQTGR